ncbi:amino acid transporter AVT1E-like [Pollicipes pollicipes]|uniref:amino acid transporter AVT1E-like n=1 Tax=Pollicipes pollicipes TaxID=41117 RepID=UPI001884C256|nr:amino acid transporter AVT1E-like [Pollicipes pollicipes]
MMACPRATINAGWVGFLLFFACGSMSAFNGILLTWSRSILEERYPEYNGHVRSPFAEIATKAFGRPGRMLFNFCIFMSHFGAAVVNMLLCAELMESFTGWSRCFCIPLIAMFFMPSSCLPSPAKFRKITYMGLMAAMVACLCCIIKLSLVLTSLSEPVTRTPATLQSFSLGLATIMFSFAGAGALPTIQNDMGDRSKFAHSVFLGYSGLIVLFTTMSSLGYTALGDQLSANIINSLPDGDFRKISQVAFTVSLTTATYTLINPVFRQVEGPLKIEGPDMSLKQVIVRTLMIGCMVIVGLTVPSFDKILNLLGSTTIGVLAFVFPPLFYFRLMTQHEEGWPERRIPAWQKVAVPCAVLLSVVGTACAFQAAIRDFVSAESLSGSCLIPM